MWYTPNLFEDIIFPTGSLAVSISYDNGIFLSSWKTQVLFDDDKQIFVAVQKFPIGMIVFWTYSVT